MAEPLLLPQHAQLITESAISEEVAKARGYRSVNGRQVPSTGHLIACDRELDGRIMKLDDAVRKVERSLRAAIIGCIPGKLAYYYGESGEQRILLKRPH